MAGLTALIPLDGTDLSESAFALLPALKQLGFDRVKLVSAWEETWGDEENIPGRQDGELKEITERGRAYLQAYLEKHAGEIQAQGFAVDIDVRVGRAADAILASAEDVDMIAIATHGRSGIARWRLGSVADKVIREVECPDLVIGPNVESNLASYSIRRILVPVDGSALSEQSLPIAAWIADLTGAEIDLVRVVSITPLAMDQSAGVYPVDLLSAMEDAAGKYLARIASQLGSSRKVNTTLLIGNAGEQILEFLKQTPCDLVIVASHGRSGVVRAALGSVADRLLHGPAPVLVFRPDDESESRLVVTAREAVGEIVTG